MPPVQLDSRPMISGNEWWRDAILVLVLRLDSLLHELRQNVRMHTLSQVVPENWVQN